MEKLLISILLLVTFSAVASAWSGLLSKNEKTDMIGKGQTVEGILQKMKERKVEIPPVLSEALIGLERQMLYGENKASDDQIKVVRTILVTIKQVVYDFVTSPKYDLIFDNISNKTISDLGYFDSYAWRHFVQVILKSPNAMEAVLAIQYQYRLDQVKKILADPLVVETVEMLLTNPSALVELLLNDGSDDRSLEDDLLDDEYDDE